MIEVYHGSNVIVDKPVITRYVRPLDFGAGFYVTTYYNQAKIWAEKRKNRDGKIAVVNRYDLNLACLNIKEFTGTDEAWIDFVILNRNTKKLIRHDFDIIIGEVANDQV